MKTLIPRFFIVSAALATWALGSACSPQNSNAQTKTEAPVVSTNSLAVALDDAPTPDSALKSDAPLPSAPAPLPDNVSPSSPLAQVIRLTQAGVDQRIIMTFVTNSSHTFNLDSDKIIYLSDLGAPTELVTAIMERDQQLQNQFSADQAVQLAQQTPAVEPAPPAGPAPTNTNELAAQPDTQPAPVTINYFNDMLQPYGNWVVVNGYGRCWRPTAVAYDTTWQPYCNRGNWVYTDCGWYWNSDYAWGATFHYGRWFRDASVGWCWYPGTVWAPSWVTWRYSNNYCGWAPLPPRTAYQAGVGIVYNGGGVSVGFGFGLGANCYTFVPSQRFCDPHPRNYCVAPAQVTQIYNNTVVINNFNGNHHKVVNNGIAVGKIATATRTTINQVPVHEIHPGMAQNTHGQPFNHFGQGPGVNRSNSAGTPGAPARNEPVAQNRLPRANHDWHASASPSQLNGVPNQNQPGRAAVSAPQRTLRPSQNPPAGSSPTTVSANGHQTATPRNFTPGSTGSQNPNGRGQNRSGQPPVNNYASQNHNQMFASIPQRTAPEVKHPSPTAAPMLPAQTPASNFRQPSAPATLQPAGTPRASTYRPSGSENIGMGQNQNIRSAANNYVPPRNNNQAMNNAQQNYRSAPARAPVSSPQQGGNQGGNRGRAGH